MESLKIENFLTIRQAEIEIKQFTIFIGPQGSGKSVIAKLLYFFREFLQKQFLQSINNLDHKRDLQKAGLRKFEQLFPIYTWGKQDFSITYKHGDIEVSLARNESAYKKRALSLGYSENLASIHRQAKNTYKKEQKANEKHLETKDEVEIFLEIIKVFIKTSPHADAFKPSVFIPASRSFFATLQQAVFSFLANNIPIDPLIREFGSVYEFGKGWSNSPSHFYIQKSKEWIHSFESLFAYLERIVVGKYVYENGQDWIVSGNSRINLANASSGQQESLPMLIVLLSRSLVFERFSPTTFFIEEPEAHLFPVAQKDVVELLAKLGNLTNNRYVITTHSPYILTALNNLVYAKNLAAYQNEQLDKQVSEFVPLQAQVSFENISAYVVEGGEVATILDEEVKLIGTSIIDKVSDQFDAVFSKLLELESKYV